LASFRDARVQEILAPFLRHGITPGLEGVHMLKKVDHGHLSSVVGGWSTAGPAGGWRARPSEIGLTAENGRQLCLVGLSNRNPDTGRPNAHAAAADAAAQWTLYFMQKDGVSRGSAERAIGRHGWRALAEAGCAWWQNP
jgi:hypothetical protein